MKIGLIGNMNNNNFSLMRYFRDLGADAHLLLYSNDGLSSLSHFTPEADTWDLKCWAPFIHQTEIPNAPISAFDFPLSFILGIRARFRSKTTDQDFFPGPVSREEIRNTYGDYDLLIASGSSPAALIRIDRGLDLFYPYSMGVEFLGSYVFTASSRGSWIRRMFGFAIRRQQLKGLLRSKSVIVLDNEVTGLLCSKLGIPNLLLSTPMVYNKENLPLKPITSTQFVAEKAITNADFTVLHHARLMWTHNESYSEEENFLATKNSDWLIHAFSKLLSRLPSLRACLLIVEYGPDVAATKELVRKLGIHENVTWLPVMSRREIMWILSRISVGVGEFMNPSRMIWGGTGWETLAAGKPLLQRNLFNDGEFATMFGYPPPPMLSVRTESDVFEQLLYAAECPEEVAKIGQAACEWFDTYNGIAMAKRWLDVVCSESSTANH
ncbi:glycosyltransferase [Synechococcus sp. MVIR-18-1]|uniref:glycosyltransferase n=1 Tax=Synechococcus sp. MVIR-18-1 TaxID=1386941 RepID=UPI00164479E5|nr:glycosyltransferase [Synechococcus sp. MVIR-18-1]QNI75228.1 hypothetical protein SynMVIR181_00214 [Synechococcus sp. MVIR-18-1]